MEHWSADISETVRPLVAAFDALGILYYIGGSVAGSTYGMARATMDVDIVADIPASKAKALVERIAPFYYADEHSIVESLREKRSFNIVHLETMLKVDVFATHDTAWEQSAFERRRLDTLGESDENQLTLASPEDIILSKLVWFRKGGESSQQQWRDILGILAVQGNALDHGYLDQWSSQLDVTDLLERVRRETCE